MAKVEEQKAQSTRITPSPTIASRSSAGKRATAEHIIRIAAAAPAQRHHGQRPHLILLVEQMPEQVV